MESGVETRNSSHPNQKSVDNVDARKRFRLVQRGQIGKLANSLLYRSVNHHGTSEPHAAVHDAMPDRVDLTFDIGDRRSERGGIEGPLTGFQILREQHRIVPGEESEFEARRAGIYDQDAHEEN